MLWTFAKRVSIAVGVGAILAAGAQAEPSSGAAPGPPVPAGTAPHAPATPPPTAPPSGTKAVVVDLGTMDAVIGKSVRSATGEDMGRLIDVVVESNGQVRAAIIDFGGVLGVGSRKIAVDWRALDFSGSAKGGPIKMALTRNQVRLSPEFRAGEPIVILEGASPDVPPQTSAPKAAAAPAPPAPTAK